MEPSELDNWVRWRIYRTFMEEARPPTVGELALESGRLPLEMEASLVRLADALAIVLVPGTHHVLMAHPFSAVPTAYPVAAGGKRYWANCAWDALGIPAMLGLDSETRTSCPDCGEEMSLRVEGGAASPSDAVVHFLVPAARFWEDIGFT